MLGRCMLRIKTEEGWILIGHKDHARLAGAFAAAWDDSRFPRPQPLQSVLTAVACHDDSWEERDAEGFITSDGLPSAFTKELVGSYDAFEEIDLEDYLNVRAAATEKMASEDPYAAILISMHTVNLLTEQADLSTLNSEERAIHSAFIQRQYARQSEFAAQYENETGDAAGVREAALQRAFEFLQACDSLSLVVCVRYEENIPLRHKHLDTMGKLHSIECSSLGDDRYVLSPFPFAGSEQTFSVNCCYVKGHRYPNINDFRQVYASGRSDCFSISLNKSDEEI